MQSASIAAWNNFVMRSSPHDYQAGDIKRSAAIASLFMGLANNGGLNSFLTSSYDLDAAEVVDALTGVGARQAAGQLSLVLSGLGTPMPAMSQDARLLLLDARWTESLNEFDVLSSVANAELLQALERHVHEHEVFYAALR